MWYLSGNCVATNLDTGEVRPLVELDDVLGWVPSRSVIFSREDAMFMRLVTLEYMYTNGKDPDGLYPVFYWGSGIVSTPLKGSESLLQFVKSFGIPKSRVMYLISWVRDTDILKLTITDEAACFVSKAIMLSR